MTANKTRLSETNADDDATNLARLHRSVRYRWLGVELGLLLIVGLSVVMAPTAQALTIAFWAVSLAAMDLAVMVISWRPHLRQLNKTTTQLEDIISRLRSTVEEMRQRPELDIAARHALRQLDNLNLERRRSRFSRASRSATVRAKRSG